MSNGSDFAGNSRTGGHRCDVGADVTAGGVGGVVDDGGVFVDGLAAGVFCGDGDVAPVGAIETAVEVEVDIAAGVAGDGYLECLVVGGGVD